MFGDRSSIVCLICALSLIVFAPSTSVAKTNSSASAKSKSSRSAKSSSKKKYTRSKRRKKYRRRKRRKRSRHRRVAQVGILVESKNGDVIKDKLSSVPFNPASAIKILTAYGAVKKLGPTYRFPTDLYVDGNLNEDTGLLDGNVYVRSSDPEFLKSDAISLAKALTDHGVKTVKGKLFVSKNFSLYSWKNPSKSASGLAKIFRYAIKDKAVKFSNGVFLGSVPKSARLVHHQDSEMLSYTLKQVLSLSLNSTAERIGDYIGGVKQLRKIVNDDLAIKDNKLKIETASGLGHNRITAKEMMVVLKAFDQELKSHGLALYNLLSIGGVDGTLEKRFTDSSTKGSVAAKTGTLSHTDGGVSALVGVARSIQEDFFFVVFSWHGGVYSMRKQQDILIKSLQAERGGPKSFLLNK